MRSIDVAPLPILELESHLDEVAGHRLKGRDPALLTRAAATRVRPAVGPPAGPPAGPAGFPASPSEDSVPMRTELLALKG